MSASDEREMESAIALANEIAKMNTRDTMLGSSPNQRASSSSAELSTECESPRSKLTSFKLPFKKSPRPERPSFSDEMDKIDVQQEAENPEAQEAYNLLVAQGSRGASGAQERRQRRPQRVRRSGELNRLSADSSDADSKSTSSGEGRNSVVIRRLSSETEDVKPSSVGLLRDPPPAVPPKPKVSPFTAEGKSFISAPLESAMDRKKIGTVELKSIERVQGTVSRVSIPDRTQAKPEPEEARQETNPLRMIRSGNAAVFRPTGRQNGISRKFSTDECSSGSSAAASTAFVSSYRRKLSDGAGGPPPPASRVSGIPTRGGEELGSGNNPPLPPRDLNRPGSLNVKPRVRKYPLLIDETTYANTGRLTNKMRPNIASTASNGEATNGVAATIASTASITASANQKTGYTPLADCSAEQLGFFNDMDPFWSQEVTFDENGTEEMPKMTAKYKMPDSNVSYEDLLEFATDSEER